MIIKMINTQTVLSLLEKNLFQWPKMAHFLQLTDQTLLDSFIAFALFFLFCFAVPGSGSNKRTRTAGAAGGV